MNSTDFSYAAGYIDGDGCFQIGNQRWGSHLVVVSTRKDPIIWFSEHFDGSIRSIKPRTKNRSISYHFRFSEKGLKHLPSISSYLVEKTEEASIFKQFRESRGEFRKNPFVEKMNFLKEKHGLINESLKEELTSIRKTLHPSQEDFAYLAGYIDAECSLDISRTIQKGSDSFTYRAQIQCNNTKYPFFYWASKRFGGQFHFLDKSHIPHCRNQLLWRISNLQLDPILERILPFLISKKTICEKLIELRKLTNTGEKRMSSNHPNFKHWNAHFLIPQKEAIYNEVRHLNSI